MLYLAIELNLVSRKAWFIQERVHELSSFVRFPATSSHLSQSVLLGMIVVAHAKINLGLLDLFHLIFLGLRRYFPPPLTSLYYGTTL